MAFSLWPSAYPLGIVFRSSWVLDAGDIAVSRRLVLTLSYVLLGEGSTLRRVSWAPQLGDGTVQTNAAASGDTAMWDGVIGCASFGGGNFQSET